MYILPIWMGIIIMSERENFSPIKISLKGSWKREKWGVGKESNVRIWCRTVAIDVYLQFEHAVFEKNLLFPFPLIAAK